VTLNQLPHWPPKWQRLLLRSEKLVCGEIGVLASVTSLNLSDDYVSLRVEHEGVQYCGILDAKPVPSTQVTAILATQTGRSIEEIGNLENRS
jgi:hypothetical protein